MNAQTPTEAAAFVDPFPSHDKPKAEQTEQGGSKLDAGKARIELVPSELIFAVAQVLTFGAQKYADRNWEKGLPWSRVFGALMRHMWCWWAGKGPSTENFVFGSNDDETGYSHLWHAAACIAFLISYEERGTGTDDRAGA